MTIRHDSRKLLLCFSPSYVAVLSCTLSLRPAHAARPRRRCDITRAARVPPPRRPLHPGRRVCAALHMMVRDGPWIMIRAGYSAPAYALKSSFFCFSWGCINASSHLPTWN
ncbi:hypothetical protein C8R45DRAFT_1033872 [Mycena sanguinolenta]|nr:hypothetical protein C8R45DRAFT_1033872 [Mycena sanguinolenta]